ncbi:MAG: hydroxymethylglutaryl-CoA lyase [Pseudomonadota bacterium]
MTTSFEPVDVLINEVGPRDGLQSQTKILETSQKESLVNALLNANINSIEIGAFVSPKAVPAMAGTDELIAQYSGDTKQKFNALIPNMRGYESAVSNGITLLSLVVAASNTMNENNIRMTTEQILQVSAEVLKRAKSDGIDVQAYIATSWVCPFEGDIAVDQVVDVCEKLSDAGVSKLIISDTIGAADPQSVKQLMTILTRELGGSQFACHFHDTRAMGLANVYAALEAGIRQFDSSIAGLGGCPFAPGASGNVATEDVVMMLEQMGFNTGIDMQQLLVASDIAIELTGTAKGGRAKPWLQQQKQQHAA